MPPVYSKFTFEMSLLMLSMMSLMIQSHHLGLMWVALETLTLASPAR